MKPWPAFFLLKVPLKVPQYETHTKHTRNTRNTHGLHTEQIRKKTSGYGPHTEINPFHTRSTRTFYRKIDPTHELRTYRRVLQACFTCLLAWSSPVASPNELFCSISGAPTHRFGSRPMSFRCFLAFLTLEHTHNVLWDRSLGLNCGVSDAL